MKKLYIVLLSTMASILFLVGAFSVVNLCLPQTHREDEVTAPVFSAQSLTSGTFLPALENYYTDHFPFRDFLMDVSRVMNRVYYFAPGQNLLSIDYHGGAEEGGASLETPETDIPPEPVQENLPDESEVTSVGTIIIHGNRAMDIPTAIPENIDLYGQTVNRMAEAVGDDVRVFSLITPNSGEFYSPRSFHTGLHNQKDMIDRCYGVMSDDVIPVDAYSVMRDHKDEYLFFRTDHHWTQKGAYYAYTAFCREAGFDAPALSDFESGTYENFVGSMFNYTSGYPQSQMLKDNPDTLTYYLPIAEVSAEYYRDPSLTDGVSIPVIDRDLREDLNNKYLCYISGDTPICVLESNVDGGTCVVLKESYGNAFVPFLTSHYSKVICIDPREFGGKGEPTLDLPAFLREQGADDLLILNYPFMMSNGAYIRYLSEMLPE